jgi:cytochrome c-type biogenesis protein
VNVNLDVTLPGMMAVSGLLRGLASHARLFVTSPSNAQFAVAFGAGVLSTLNPCGFALLPAYISYTVEHQVHIASDHRPSNWHDLLRGGLLGLPLTAGFLLVFLLAGFILTLGGRLLVHLFPWLAILVGAGLVLLGGWSLLTGRAPEIGGLSALSARLSWSSPGGSAPTETQAQTPSPVLRAAWVFGVGYGLSSLGCALPVFLLVVGTASTTGGVGGAALVLASYAAGMALVLLAVTLAATTLGDLLRSAVVPLLRWVLPLSSLFLIAAGLYIVVYQVRAGLW